MTPNLRATLNTWLKTSAAYDAAIPGSASARKLSAADHRAYAALYDACRALGYRPRENGPCASQWAEASLAQSEQKDTAA